FIGDDAFLTGIRDYLTRHSFGNGTLADFLRAMEVASGRELDAWSRGWLETAGVDEIEVARMAGTISRTAPAEYPADRPHVLDIATYEGGVQTSRVDLTLEGPEAPVPDLDVEAPLVLPNAGDRTWATPVLDGRSLDALRGQLPLMSDAQ